MAIIFAVRGTQMNAYYSTFASQWGSAYGGAGGTSIPALTADNSAGIFGGSYIAKAATVARTLQYPGFTNVPSNNVISILMRIIPRWSGNPAGIEHLISICSPSANGVSKIEIMIDTAGKIRFRNTDQAGVGLSLVTGTVAFNPTNGTPVDLFFSWDGTTSAGAFKISVDGSNLDTLTITSVTNSAPTTPLSRALITMGHGVDTQRSNWDLNELLIYNTAENQVYSTRTTFTTVTAGEGFPAVGVVKTGEVYPQLGSWSTQTGTYDGSDRWTDPGEANVRNATAYKANSTSNNKTGTLIAAEYLWTIATSSLTSAGTIGKLLADNIDATISSRSTLTAANVWDRLTSALSVTSTIGKLLVDKIDATISSRLADADYVDPPTPPTTGEIADAVLDDDRNLTRDVFLGLK